MKTYKMKLILGDWSGDGHNISEKVLLEVNHPVETIQNAYKSSVKKTGIAFHDKSGEFKGKTIATNYEQGLDDIPEEVLKVLKEYNIETPQSEDGDQTEEYTKLWFDFVKLSLPDVQYKIIEDKIPNINGFYDKNLNASFGYGLFSN